MKVSDLFVKCLENEGVRYVFGIPGEEIEDLLFSPDHSSFQFPPTRHEQGAAFMADVWGRLTGKAGVCLATLGPGATNLVTGVADANLDKSPVVAITGQAGVQRVHKENHQYLDIVSLFRPITKWNATIAHPDTVPVDFTSAEVYAHYQPAVEIVADIATTLRELNRMFAEECRTFDFWYTPVRDQILRDFASYTLKPRQRFTVPGTLNILRAVMADEDLLISDVGSHKLWIARNFPVNAPNCCLISNGLASMGFALPGAVAASLCSPGRKIVAAMGDGGFLMNSQELETAKRAGAVFTVLLFTDNDYGLISWKQKMSHKRTAGTRITNPEFQIYARSFGIKSFAPKNPEELSRDLKKALSSGELCFVEVPVETSVNFRLTGKSAST